MTQQHILIQVLFCTGLVFCKDLYILSMHLWATLLSLVSCTAVACRDRQKAWQNTVCLQCIEQCKILEWVVAAI